LCCAGGRSELGRDGQVQVQSDARQAAYAQRRNMIA
jgi:hypothetical protein